MTQAVDYLHIPPLSLCDSKTSSGITLKDNDNEDIHDIEDNDNIEDNNDIEDNIEDNDGKYQFILSLCDSETSSGEEDDNDDWYQ